MILVLEEKRNRGPVRVNTRYIAGMKRIEGDPEDMEESFTRIDMSNGSVYRVRELPEEILAAGSPIGMIRKIMDKVKRRK